MALKRIFTLVWLVCLLQLPLWAQTKYPQIEDALRQVSNDSIDTYVKQLTGLLPYQNSDTIKSRLAQMPGNQQTFDFLRNKLLSWGIAADSQVFSISGRNLFANIGGTNSEKYMMLGAHYDAVGTTNPLFHFPGADDNASGVAAVLEAARVLRKYEWPFSIRLAFWDEEETGLLGSKAYCVPNDIKNFMGYINLDMIAYDNDNDSLFEIHTLPVSHSLLLAQRISECVSTYQIPLRYRIINPGEPNTDQQPFWDAGMTATGVNEDYTSTDFNPTWHRRTDSITYFNMPYFHSMVRLAIASLADCVQDTNRVMGLSTTQSPGGFYLYPNPAGPYVTVHGNGNTETEYTLINHQGQVVKTAVLSASATRIPLLGLPVGMYILELKQENKIYHLRLIHTEE